MKRAAIVWFLSIGLLYLGGCAEAPKKETPQAPQPPAKVSLPPQADTQVSPAEEKGDHLAAAREYSQLAAQSSAEQKHFYQLRMAENLLLGGYLEPARQALMEMQGLALNPDHQTSRHILLARIAQQERQPRKMLQELQPAPAKSVHSKLRRQFFELRATAYQMLGNHFEFAKERIRLEPYLEKDELGANHEAIWNALSLINTQLLAQLRTEPPPDQLSGWLELAHISKAYLDKPAQMKERLQQWHRLYPQHPATDDMYESLVKRKIEQPIRTERIAVLLPLTGRYSAAGNAIREGIMAAYYDTTAQNDATELRFYDTAANADILSLYDQAVADGSSVVLGPLHKEKAGQLQRRGEFPVPTIALNYTGLDQVEENFFQFSLLPEEEVKQAAERMWQDGYNSVALISPEGAWGDRLLGAFKQRWQQYNNVDLDIYRYDEKKEGIANSVKKVLNIDTSKQRIRNLRYILGRGIKYTERRRKDIDVIFVLGINKKDAAQIRPQLKYFGADDIPVYSTSQIYSLTINRRMARDMDGILFCDMPWILGTAQGTQRIREDLNNNFDIDQSPNIRLYAFGVDAFKVLPLLRSLQLSPFERYEGATGYLHVDKQRHIERELEWAYFDRGEVHPISDLITEESESNKSR